MVQGTCPLSKRSSVGDQYSSSISSPRLVTPLAESSSCSAAFLRSILGRPAALSLCWPMAR
eukprot:5986161-Pleurochrysis_carterae.AAC.1